jgi:hypothetical protein
MDTNLDQGHSHNACSRFSLLLSSFLFSAIHLAISKMYQHQNFVTLRLTVYHQSVQLGTEPLETHNQKFCSQLNIYSHSPYITSSLMRGWVCYLILLLALASTFILGPESCGTRDHILLSQIRDFPFCYLLRLTGLRWRYLTLPPHGKVSL